VAAGAEPPAPAQVAAEVPAPAPAPAPKHVAAKVPAPAPKHVASAEAEHHHHASGAALYQRGIAAFNRGDLGHARADFTASAHAGHVPAYRALGVVYRRQGNRAAAIHAFRTYLRKAPRSHDARAVGQLVAQLEHGR